MRIEINAYYKRVRYMLKGRIDGEEGREKKITIISNIKVIVAIIIYTPLLIALYYI